MTPTYRRRAVGNIQISVPGIVCLSHRDFCVHLTARHSPVARYNLITVNNDWLVIVHDVAPNITFLSLFLASVQDLSLRKLSMKEGKRKSVMGAIDSAETLSIGDGFLLGAQSILLFGHCFACSLLPSTLKNLRSPLLRIPNPAKLMMIQYSACPDDHRE